MNVTDQATSAPTPFCFNRRKVKAIVLGADPTNFSDHSKPVKLSKAFGIGDGDPRYFQGILSNLKSIGISLEDIYVTNVISDQLEYETSKNKDWQLYAEKSLHRLIADLDGIDPKRKIPVFLTAEVIYKFMLYDDLEATSAKDLYSNPHAIPIDKENNKLGRYLIPLYRHPKYILSSVKWKGYRNRIIQLLNKNIEGNS